MIVVLIVISVALASACGDTDGGADGEVAGAGVAGVESGTGAGATAGASGEAAMKPVAGAYSVCDHDVRVGGFEVILKEATTAIDGVVAGGVVPMNVPDVVLREGGCRLLRPPQLRCEPACGSGDTCDASGDCVPFPVGQDVGEVTITGLKSPVAMQARAPTQRYFFSGDLEHPGFAAGDVIGLSAVGGEAGPFALTTLGVAPLEVDGTTVALESGQPTVVRWTSAGASEAVGMDLELNIALHGGTPGRVECETDDSGEIEIPAALVTALLDSGYSGFPSLRVTRQGADAVDTDLGCVDLRVKSDYFLTVEIDGLVSCSTPDDCPPGQVCQPDLRCE